MQFNAKLHWDGFKLTKLWVTSSWTLSAIETLEQEGFHQTNKWIIHTLIKQILIEVFLSENRNKATQRQINNRVNRLDMEWSDEWSDGKCDGKKCWGHSAEVHNYFIRPHKFNSRNQTWNTDKFVLGVATLPRKTLKEAKLIYSSHMWARKKQAEERNPRSKAAMKYIFNPRTDFISHNGLSYTSWKNEK